MVRLLEEAHGVIHHVGLLGEFILGGLYLLDGEEIALGKMSKEGEDKVTVAVGNNRFCEIVLGHFEKRNGGWR